MWIYSIQFILSQKTTWNRSGEKHSYYTTQISHDPNKEVVIQFCFSVTYSNLFLSGSSYSFDMRIISRKFLTLTEVLHRFFHRNYELQLRGGTPFEKGVEVDSAVSMKSKCLRFAAVYLVFSKYIIDLEFPRIICFFMCDLTAFQASPTASFNPFSLENTSP